MYATNVPHNRIEGKIVMHYTPERYIATLDGVPGLMHTYYFRKVYLSQTKTEPL